jgi:hypothetical protein
MEKTTAAPLSSFEHIFIFNSDSLGIIEMNSVSNIIWPLYVLQKTALRHPIGGYCEKYSYPKNSSNKNPQKSRSTVFLIAHVNRKSNFWTMKWVLRRAGNI